MKTIDTTLSQQLTDDCQAFVDRVCDLSEAQFLQHLPGKWSVADVMQHLYLSARPVARLMTGPREVFTQWGEADAPSQTYDDIASAYTNILAMGAKAPVAFSPRPEDMQAGVQTIIGRFTGVYQTLVDALPGWTDGELDRNCIPHPAFSKLTVREMLYFTSFHTRHHLERLRTE